MSGKCDNDIYVIMTVANPGKQAWKPKRKAQAFCRLLGDKLDSESWKRAEWRLNCEPGDPLRKENS